VDAVFRQLVHRDHQDQMVNRATTERLETQERTVHQDKLHLNANSNIVDVKSVAKLKPDSLENLDQKDCLAKLVNLDVLLTEDCVDLQDLPDQSAPQDMLETQDRLDNQARLELLEPSPERLVPLDLQEHQDNEALQALPEVQAKLESQEVKVHQEILAHLDQVESPADKDSQEHRETKGTGELATTVRLHVPHLDINPDVGQTPSSLPLKSAISSYIFVFFGVNFCFKQRV